jgi:hypothetical protein
MCSSAVRSTRRRAMGRTQSSCRSERGTQNTYYIYNEYTYVCIYVYSYIYTLGIKRRRAMGRTQSSCRSERGTQNMHKTLYIHIYTLVIREDVWEGSRYAEYYNLYNLYILFYIFNKIYI